jgi:hypothetical protein
MKRFPFDGFRQFALDPLGELAVAHFASALIRRAALRQFISKAETKSPERVLASLVLREPDGNAGLLFQHQRLRQREDRVAVKPLVVFGGDGPSGVGFAVNCVRDRKAWLGESASALANLTLRGLS